MIDRARTRADPRSGDEHRPRPNLGSHLKSEDASSELAVINGACKDTNPIAFRARKGAGQKEPQRLVPPLGRRLLPRKRSPSSLSRQRLSQVRDDARRPQVQWAQRVRRLCTSDTRCCSGPSAHTWYCSKAAVVKARVNTGDLRGKGRVSRPRCALETLVWSDAPAEADECSISLQRTYIYIEPEGFLPSATSPTSSLEIEIKQLGILHALYFATTGTWSQ